MGLVAAVGLFAAAGCGVSAGMDDVATEDFQPSHEVGFAEDASGVGGAETSLEAFDSKIAVSGYADVITKDPIGAAKSFKEAVLDEGGRIDSEWTQNDPGYLSASVTARIPADKYEVITEALPTFGHVQTFNTSAEDFGQQYVDYSARKDALEDSIARVRVLADEAETTQDLLAAEELLTQQQSELDSLVQQLDWIDRQVSMSTLTVSFETEQVGTSESPISWAWIVNLLMESLRVLLVLVIFTLPWAVIGGGVFFIIRAALRSRRAKKESKKETEKEKEKPREMSGDDNLAARESHDRTP